MRKLSIGAAALLTLPLAMPAAPEVVTPPACIDGTSQSFSATGAKQPYSVPAGTTALLITANGASGGNGFPAEPAGVPIQGGPPASAPGGFGAHLIAGVPVSGLTTLDVVVGSAGATPGTPGSSGAGGGGSFVFTPGGTLLVAAGGGGGAGGGFAPIPGVAAQLVTGGASGVGSGFGPGGTSGSGGIGGTVATGAGGGGGGFLGAGTNGIGPGSGFGGHQISPPGDAGGGAPGVGGGAGGFGGGGGSATGGGGGGYSGGGGGGFLPGTAGAGGGGGSFVAASGTTFASSLLTGPGNGSVIICATAIALSPTLSKAFGDASVKPGGTTRLTFALSNPNASLALTGVGFTDTLPAGLLVADPNGLTGSCGGGTITATAFTATVSLAGATLPASGSCSFSVNVVATSTGSKDNTTSPVISNEAASGAAATATVTVVEGASIPTLSSWGLMLMITALGGLGALAVRRRLRV